MKRVRAGLIKAGLDDELLLLLGEELKGPLVNIMQLAEMGPSDPRIAAQAQRALNTIDTLLLYRRFASGQTEMRLEPVHVGSAVAEVVQILKPQFEMHGCQTRLQIQSSLRPVDVDRRLLSSALLSLWQAMIASADASDVIICRIATTGRGVRLSLLSMSAFENDISFSATNVSSRQPVTGVAGPAADLLAARGMFGLADSKLTKSRHGEMTGLGVTLRVSRQTQLV